MIKLVALYGKPRDPAHFDRYPSEVHVPLDPPASVRLLGYRPPPC